MHSLGENCLCCKQFPVLTWASIKDCMETEKAQIKSIIITQHTATWVVKL